MPQEAKKKLKLTDYVLLGYHDALDYLAGDDTARGRFEPDKEENFQAWLAYRDGWRAAYADEFNARHGTG